MANGEEKKSNRWVKFLPFIFTVFLFVTGVAYEAGYNSGRYATKDDLKQGLDDARRERMETISKSLEEHKDNQREEMKRVYSQLDRIESKLDRIRR